MKKHILLIIAILFLPLIVVGDDCYTRTRQKAIDAYNRGEYDYAKGLFQSAKEDCIETPTNNDIDSWINKCSSAKREQTKLKQQLVSKTTQMGTHNGHDYVDLGLSVKWATCNVGATKPEEYGNYFAWGEIIKKDKYDWATYKYCNGSSTTLTKYCNKRSFANNGVFDAKNVLEFDDDIAHVYWGGSWRMPTKEEIEELRNNCTESWVSQNGVYGIKVTGKNGNSIFLPAAGYILGEELNYEGKFVYYWSSSLNKDYSRYSYSLSGSLCMNGSGCLEVSFYSRTLGLSIRPICP